jgi:thiamine pyrophosphate-dependent acetolactate synthase large subunit-like protein
VSSPSHGAAGVSDAFGRGRPAAPKMEGQPVIAITGLQFHDLIGAFTQQDVVLDKLFEDVAVFNEGATSRATSPM